MTNAPASHDADAATRASQVVLRDAFPRPLHTVAGFCVEVTGATTVASAVLLDAGTLTPLDRQMVAVASADESAPRLSALLAALAALAAPPDLALVEGHGIAHPGGFGIASHFGVATDLPCIGVATAIDTGTARLALHEMRGAFTPLRDGPRQIGWLLRSLPDRPPLVVSPGHRVSLASAPQLVMRFVTADRRPEPTRLARLLLHDSPAAGDA